MLLILCEVLHLLVTIFALLAFLFHNWPLNQIFWLRFFDIISNRFSLNLWLCKILSNQRLDLRTNQRHHRGHKLILITKKLLLFVCCDFNTFLLKLLDNLFRLLKVRVELVFEVNLLGRILPCVQIEFGWRDVLYALDLVLKVGCEVFYFLVVFVQ